MYLQDWTTCCSSNLSARVGTERPVCFWGNSSGRCTQENKKGWREIMHFIFLNCSLCQWPQRGVSLSPVCHCSIMPCFWKVQTQRNERATSPVILTPVCSYQFAWVERPQRALLKLRCGAGVSRVLVLKTSRPAPMVFCGRWHCHAPRPPLVILVLALAFKHIV